MRYAARIQCGTLQGAHTLPHTTHTACSVPIPYREGCLYTVTRQAVPRYCRSKGQSRTPRPDPAPSEGSSARSCGTHVSRPRAHSSRAVLAGRETTNGSSYLPVCLAGRRLMLGWREEDRALREPHHTGDIRRAIRSAGNLCLWHRL